MPRVVEPELLDDLSPADPRAINSRMDLRRLNTILGHAGTMTRAFCSWRENHPAGSQPLRIADLGAGDGTLLLEVARRWSALGVTARATLVDRQDLVSEDIERAFTTLNWAIGRVRADALAWLEHQPEPAHVLLANLFLHHFPHDSLRALLRQAAAKTELFIACEPRRVLRARLASRLLRLIGCNPVTRHDAMVSVRAGFTGRELSALWPASEGWRLVERPIGWFSHCFIAERHG